MNYGKLQWLFPIAITFHNGEEAISMPGWVLRHASALLGLAGLIFTCVQHITVESGHPAGRQWRRGIVKLRL